MIIEAILCVNTFSQTHEEEAATRKHYVSSDMTNCLCLLQIWKMLHQVWKRQCPPCGTKIFLTYGHEPELYVRTTETNDDHNALAETSTAETETTSSGADENDDDPDNEHAYVNTESDENIEFKNRYR